MSLPTLLLIFFLLLALLILIIWLIVTVIFGATMIFGAPYVASRDDKLKTILQLIKEVTKSNRSNPHPNLKIADLGSGNAKVLIAIAQLAEKMQIPVDLHGYEINPLLVWYSRMRIKWGAIPPFTKERLGGVTLKKTNKNSLTMKQFNNIKIFNQSFFSTDLSSYDIITLYATTYIMKKLEKKLQNELKPGAIVISNYFQFPNWKPSKSLNHVYLYTQS